MVQIVLHAGVSLRGTLGQGSCSANATSQSSASAITRLTSPNASQRRASIRSDRNINSACPGRSHQSRQQPGDAVVSRQCDAGISRGHYGRFGGAYIPEMLHRNVEELRTKYLEIIYDESFQKEFQHLLKDYVGRPTPLYLAKRLSKLHNTNIYLKREDLNHTGAHKINNTIGQILLALRLGLLLTL
jgi:hypothetical protein